MIARWKWTAALMAVVAPALLSPVARAADKLTVMYTASAPYMVSWVAKDQGFFSKRGLDVDFVLAANGSVIVAAVQSGSVQIGTPSPTVFLQAVDNGLDQVALASTNAYPDPAKVGLASRPDVSIKSPQDLVGKTVGVPGVGGFLDVVLHKYLADNRVDISKVRFVEVTLPQSGDALRAKQVDAVASVDPFLSRAISSGAGVFAGDYTATLPPGTIASVYSASRAWTNAHADQVKAFQEGLLESLAYIKAPGHDASVRDSIARYTKLPADVVAGLVLPNVTVDITPEQVKFWVDIAKQQGLVTNTIDPKAVIIPVPKS